MRWKEYDDDTVVHITQPDSQPVNLDVNVENSKTFVQFSGERLPESTKQKVYAAMNESGYKLGSFIGYIFFGWTALMFGGMFFNAVINIILELVTGLHFTDFSDIMNFATMIMMAIISVVLFYFISYKVLWKKLCMSNKNALKAFQTDSYIIVEEGTIVDKHHTSSESSSSYYVELSSGGRYDAMFSSQYYKMKLGDEVYVVKVNNNRPEVILK